MNAFAVSESATLAHWFRVAPSSAAMGSSKVLTVDFGTTVMNKRAFVAGLASALFCAAAPAESTATTLRLRIDNLTPSGQMTVTFNNTGQYPLRLWAAGEWSVAPWRVLHISAMSGALTTYYLDPNQIFNARPIYRELLPEKPIQTKLDLTSSFWLPRSERRTGENIWSTGDTLIVIYDIPMSAEGEKLGVWWGVAATKAVVQ